MKFIRKWFDTSRKISFWILGVVIVVFGYLIYFDRIAPSTSDASLDAYVIPIRPQVSGPITKIAVHDNQHVEKGSLLFSIDESPYRYQFQQKEAALYETQDLVQQLEAAVLKSQKEIARNQADYEDAKLHYQENQALYEKGVVTLNTLADSQDRMQQAADELAEAELGYAQAVEALGPQKDGVNVHLLKAQAALDEAAYYLEQTKVRAPVSGYVTHLRIQEGSYAQQGETQVAFVDGGSQWIIAYMKENNLDLVQPGQSVDVTLNMYPGRVFEGEVESISYGVMPSKSFSSNYLPEVEKTNNWVRLAQRFPVRIRLKNAPEGLPLRVGTSAIVTIYTQKSPLKNVLPSMIQSLRAKLQYLY